MSTEHWDSGRPVVAMAWNDLNQWSGRIRTLAHDFNNALVPAFAHTDLLRLRLGPQADLRHLDSLPAQLELARQTAHRAASWAIRPAPQRAPSWRTVQGDLLMLCRQANVALTWVAGPDLPDRCDWPTHDARHVLRILLQNSCDALRDTEDAAVRVAFAEHDQVIDIDVTDNGPGCDDLDGAADGTVARHGHGHLGLGLASAAAVAEQSGGALRINTTAAGGFRAMLRVPRRAGA